MAIPWIGLIDTFLDLTSLALQRKSRRAAADENESTAIAGRTSGSLEARMTGVVVAALKEAFDRDAKRLELERDQAERERLRAERMLRIELVRQAGEREIARLRLIAAVAAGAWIGTLFLSARVVGGPAWGRVLLGGGWLLLLIALSLSFAAQARVGRSLARIDDSPGIGVRSDESGSGAAGALAPWLIVSGLTVIGFAMLLA
jgi:hypothetical protein